MKKGEDGTLLIDWMKNLGGRGFYLCPEEACLKKAEKKKWIGSWEMIQNQISFDRGPFSQRKH